MELNLEVLALSLKFFTGITRFECLVLGSRSWGSNRHLARALGLKTRSCKFVRMNALEHHGKGHVQSSWSLLSGLCSGPIPRSMRR